MAVRAGPRTLRCLPGLSVRNCGDVSWAAWAFRFQEDLARALSTCAELHVLTRPFHPRFNVCRGLHTHPVLTKE